MILLDDCFVVTLIPPMTLLDDCFVAWLTIGIFILTQGSVFKKTINMLSINKHFGWLFGW